MFVDKTLLSNKVKNKNVVERCPAVGENRSFRLISGTSSTKAKIILGPAGCGELVVLRLRTKYSKYD